MQQIRILDRSNWFSQIAFLFLLYFFFSLLTGCSKNTNLEAVPVAGQSENSSGSETPVTEPGLVVPPVTTPAPGADAGSNTSSTFSPNFKPMGLSWELASKPERVAWSNALYDLVAKYYTVLNTAADIADFCPAYQTLNKDQRINAWAGIIAATTYYESSYNPLTNSVDVGNAGDKDTYSVGLLQLSVVDQKNYGFKFGYNFTDLQNPIKNLTLGMAIMNNQINKRKVIAIKKGDPGLYWAVLYRGGKYDRVKNISDLNRSKITFCR